MRNPLGIPQLGTLAIAGGAALLTAACTFSIDAGETVTQTFDVEDFDRLEVGSAFDATVVIGDETGVSFNVGEEVVDRLEVEVVDGKLIVGFDDGFLKTSGPLEVTITTPTLSSVELDGAVDMEIDGIDAEDFEVNAGGAVSLDANGTVETLTLNAGGATNIDLEDVVIETATVDIGGASTVIITDVQAVSGSIDGASTVEVPNTGTIDIDSSGVSSVDMVG